MILATLLAVAAVAGQADAQPCFAEQGCVQTGPAQLFVLADKLFREGDLAGAAEILEALTQDRELELRTEARFRLAAVREKMGDLGGAASALRDLLAEKPDANPARLELARILSRSGQAKAARAELAKAQAAGLPREVEVNVRRFASSIRQARSRGLTMELSGGPDTNINRSTSSAFIDTIIAPFELDQEARRQAGVGYSASLRGYSRNSLGDVTFLSNAGLRADLSNKTRFNDVQLAVDSGPEIALGRVRARAAAAFERRWYGGSPYSAAIGPTVELWAPVASNTQFTVAASHLRQNVARNDGQGGWRTAASAELVRNFASGLTGRITARYGALDARLKPESLRQTGGGLLVVKQWPKLTLFGQADYTRTHGIEPLFLFGKTRRDRRIDLTTGAIINQARLGGFSPLIRLTHSNSRANIELYDYRRTRLDIGFTRNFE